MSNFGKISKEELQRAAANGDMEAIKSLEMMEAGAEDPFCHASGQYCPAAHFCEVSQLAKKVHDGTATELEIQQYDWENDGITFSEEGVAAKRKTNVITLVFYSLIWALLCWGLLSLLS